MNGFEDYNCMTTGYYFFIAILGVETIFTAFNIIGMVISYYKALNIEISFKIDILELFGFKRHQKP